MPRPGPRMVPAYIRLPLAHYAIVAKLATEQTEQDSISEVMRQLVEQALTARGLISDSVAATSGDAA